MRYGGDSYNKTAVGQQTVKRRPNSLFIILTEVIMNRIKGILAAGTLTGLVLITILALGWDSVGGAAANTPVEPAAIVQPMATDAGALQAQNVQLQNVLQTMQAREAQYQAQIEAANQTITQLESQPVAQSANSRASFSGEREHEGFEHDD